MRLGKIEIMKLRDIHAYVKQIDERDKNCGKNCGI